MREDYIDDNHQWNREEHTRYSPDCSPEEERYQYHEWWEIEFISHKLRLYIVSHQYLHRSETCEKSECDVVCSFSKLNHREKHWKTHSYDRTYVWNIVEKEYQKCPEKSKIHTKSKQNNITHSSYYETHWCLDNKVVLDIGSYLSDDSHDSSLFPSESYIEFIKKESTF